MTATGTRLDHTMRMLSNSANYSRLWLAVAAAGLLIPGRTRRAAIRGLGALAATSLITNAVLKPLAQRQRPAVDRTPVVRQLRRTPTSGSFPSGHAASAAAFATGVALESPLAGAAVAPLAAAVGYSRVHVGVHYASDVVAGAALGAGLALATRRWWPLTVAGPPRLRPYLPAPRIEQGEGLVVVLNPRSGPNGDPGPQLKAALPAASFIELTDEVDLDAELAGQAPDARALGAAGGDGTVASVAAAALRHGLPLAVFPTGTLNHFARDADISAVQDTLQALASGEAVAVDVATINGRPFLNTAVIGAYPEMVRRREQLEPQWGKWLAMAVAAGQVLRRHEPLRLRIDGEPATVWTLFVGNGEYRPQGNTPAWRPRLDDGWLDVQFLRADARFSRARAVLSTLAGLSGRDGLYHARLAKTVHVDSLDGALPVAHDGEAGGRTDTLSFGKLPGTLLVYRPKRPAPASSLVRRRPGGVNS
ncbi:phosphatase PAP2 family protein [Natronosporangium hydrolyticum]|uniref:Phosphatase PAP2 family protein n=1 Tax=Natronosporangium hydrolyticum TaxID=2811111 RepID=A0A895YFB7_9ACTN|nr:bifunctional phosphatase PAP2/diacylglycerol kinase family protein [Natronosporangium hydrolyticum]QSB16507.1 phosphatase PAP2 family protein [Natronosporangium hydrolyticum]